MCLARIVRDRDFEVLNLVTVEKVKKLVPTQLANSWCTGFVCHMIRSIHEHGWLTLKYFTTNRMFN